MGKTIKEIYKIQELINFITYTKNIRKYIFLDRELCKLYDIISYILVLKKTLVKLKQQQLFKEDIETHQLVSYEGQLFYKGNIKKEIYDKLPPSKDVK